MFFRLLCLLCVLFQVSLVASNQPQRQLPLVRYQFDRHGNIVDDGVYQYFYGAAPNCYKDVYQNGVLLERLENEPCAMSGGMLSLQLGNRGRQVSTAPVTETTFARGSMGSSIGVVALQPLQHTAETRPLYVATAAASTFGDTDTFFVFAVDASAQDGIQYLWQGESNPGSRSPITALHTVDFNGDGNDEILVLRASGTLDAYTLFESRPRRIFTAPQPNRILDFVPADLPGMDNPQLILRLIDSVYYLDPLSGNAARPAISVVGSGRLALGNFDQDAEPELLLSQPDSAVVVKLDGRVVAQINEPLGSVFTVANVAGDTVSEIVTINQQGARYFDIAGQAFQSLSLAYDESASTITARDLNQDGFDELLIGTTGWTGLSIYDAAATQVAAHLTARGFGVDGVHVQGDRVFWSTGGASTATDQLFTLPLADLMTRQASPATHLPFDGVFAALVPLAATQEQPASLLAAVAQAEAGSGGRLLRWSLEDGAQASLFQTSLDHIGSPAIQDMIVGQLDDDASLEVALTVIQGQAPGVLVFDLDSSALEFSHFYRPYNFNGNPIAPRLRIGNVDGDTAPELVVAYNQFVDVFSAGSFEFSNYTETGAENGLAFVLADLDSDGRDEMVFVDGPDHVRIHDFKTNQSQRLQAPDVAGVAAVSDGQGQTYILAGAGDGVAYRWTADGEGDFFLDRHFPGTPMLSLMPLTPGNTNTDWIVVGPESLELWDNDFSERIWETTDVDPNRTQRVAVIDSDRDQRPEIALLGRFGVRAWEPFACNPSTDWVTWQTPATVLDFVSALNCPAIQ